MAHRGRMDGMGRRDPVPGVVRLCVASRVARPAWGGAALAERPAVPSSYDAGARPPVDGGPIGRLEIVRLYFSAIVTDGDDKQTLRVSVGHSPDTPLPGEPGNTALPAHRDIFFRPLEDVHVERRRACGHATRRIYLSGPPDAACPSRRDVGARAHATALADAGDALSVHVRWVDVRRYASLFKET
jgi:Sortase domain